jgi:hypothetical protein
MSEMQVTQAESKEPHNNYSKPGKQVRDGTSRGGFENIERLGRFVLWISLAAVCVIVPIEYMKHQARSFESDQKRAQAEQEAEQSKAPRRLLYTSMGQSLVGVRDGEGYLTFTNVSPRTGVVCVTGTVKNAKTGHRSTSLAACEPVQPYQSEVRLKVSFAGRVYREMCPSNDCEIDFDDALESAPQVVAAR